ISRRSRRVPEIGKFSTARCVLAPHFAHSGTRTSPIESCSTRYARCVAITGRYPPSGTVAHMVDFAFQDLLPLGADTTKYRELTAEHVATFDGGGDTFLRVDPAALTLLTQQAMHDIAHYLRPGHLAQLNRILDDPEASGNDRYVARELLQNACISAGGVLPMCQDTGTALVKGKKGQWVVTGGGDKEAIARGVFRTYQHDNLRYSQLAPIDVFNEVNTGTNLPAEIEIEA